MTNFKLYANCIPVKGARRSIICDLQRKEVYVIPNELYSALSENGLELNEVKRMRLLNEYTSFLLDNELAFLTETPELFPEINRQWFFPFEISHSIVDYDKDSQYDIIQVLFQLSTLNCKFLQIRLFHTVRLSFVSEIIEYLNKIESSIISIDFILPFNNDITNSLLEELISKYPRVNSFSIYKSEIQREIKALRGNKGYIYYNKGVINVKSCGTISSSYFTLNIKSFMEGQKYNSCLNGKISIDSKGDIKNCPSMSESFGNVSNIKLKDAILFKGFKKYWNISKDRIDVCKDCEFRYICTDCRAYIEKPDDIYSKPLKCGYNPYTNKWEEWSTNPLKKKAIEYYEMEELIPNNG